MRSCYWKRDKLEERIKRAEGALLDARALLAAYDIVYSGQDESADSTEMRVKKQYIRAQSIISTAEWARENIADFAPNKARSQNRVKDIIDGECGNADLDRAAQVIYWENGMAAAKYGYGH